MNDAEYRAFLNLLMCSDDRECETVLTQLADDEARLRGFDNWRVAYRQFPGTALEFHKWWYDEGSSILPLPQDDMESHARRVAEAAWKAAVEQRDS